MNIKHEPFFKTDEVIKHYSKKDGVDIKYVCSTSLKNDTVPVDVFYRATPHPEFGNKYFGLYVTPWDDQMYICNADYIEELEFVFAEDSDGVLHYSQHRHDYHQVDENGAIDGGRSYVRCVGTVNLTDKYNVVNGEFKKAE